MQIRTTFACCLSSLWLIACGSADDATTQLASDEARVLPPAARDTSTRAPSAPPAATPDVQQLLCPQAGVDLKLENALDQVVHTVSISRVPSS